MLVFGYTYKIVERLFSFRDYCTPAIITHDLYILNRLFELKKNVYL